MPETLPPPPAPAAPNTPAPEVSVVNDPDLASVFTDPFEKLDAKAKPAPAAPAATPEPEKKDIKTPPSPEAKKDDKKEPVAPAPEKKEKKPEAAALTAHKDQLLNELKEERRIRKELEAERDKLKSSHQDTAKLSQQIAESRKEAERLQGELRAARFEVDDSFKSKYIKPLERVLNKAKSDVEQLSLIVGKDEATGEAKTRPATYNDFLELYNMPVGLAITHAKRLFGDASPVVERYLWDVRSKVEERDAALDEERTNWQKKNLEEETAKIREREMVDQIRSVVRKDIESKNPQWFAEDPDDPEGNILLKEGRELAETYFNRSGMSAQDAAIFEENIKLRLAAFTREVARSAKKDARIAELEAKLGGKKDSLPGAVRREGDGSAAGSGYVPPLEDAELNASLFNA